MNARTNTPWLTLLAVATVAASSFVKAGDFVYQQPADFIREQLGIPSPKPQMLWLTPAMKGRIELVAEPVHVLLAEVRAGHDPDDDLVELRLHDLQIREVIAAGQERLIHEHLYHDGGVSRPGRRADQVRAAWEHHRGQIEVL